MLASLLHPDHSHPRAAGCAQSFPILQTVMVALLSVQLAIPAQLLSQTPTPPAPQMTPEAATHSALPPVPHSNRPLDNDEKLLQILDRFTYGPRPGDLERLRSIGLTAWFKQQMNPQTIDDSALDARLSTYPAMQLPLKQMMQMYPTNAMIRADMNGRGPGSPRGEAEKAIYADQMDREKNKKNEKDQNPAANNTPPFPADQVAEIVSLPADKRFSALCKMRPPELQQFRRALNPDQRDHLTDGFTPRQLEALAAFNRPQNLVAAEVVQTKLLRDIYSERQLQEVMVDFWLNHFNVYIKKSDQAPYYIAAYERIAIRPHALGHFEALLVATASSAAMLNYLDNSSSIGPHSQFATRPFRNNNPKKPSGLNENYARELMELHTVGVNGGYTQRDVTEVAKVFTGWTVGRRPNASEDLDPEYDDSKHEPGPKQVLGVTIKDKGEKEGIEVLHMLATSPKTAQFISTKLAIRFVSDTPPPAMIDRMAKTFLSTNGDIRKVLLTMINSPEFFTASTYRSKVKTPQDFVVSAVRASGAEVTSPGALVDVIADLGMPLYGMLTPNGYSMTSDAWNNTAALIDRMNFALALSSNRVAGVTTNWPAILGSSSISDPALTPEAKATILETKLLHVPVSDRTHQTILTQITTDPKQQESNLRQVAIKDRKRDPFAVAPRSHHDGDLTGIDSQSALAAGLLFGSPEFQRR